MHVTQVMDGWGVLYLQVRTHFPYLGKAGTHYAEIWYVVLEQLATHLYMLRVQWICTCSLAFFVSISRDPPDKSC